MRILGTNLPEDAWFNPVAVATTGSNILLSGQQTIDGVVVGQYAAGDPRNVRALVKDQTSAIANGLYDTNSGTWTRCLDANDKTQWGLGVQVLVTGGTANGGIAYRCTTTPTNGQIIPGTSALTFAVSFFASANEMETLTLAMPAEFSVTGSPTSGNNPTITVAKANQNANLVYAGPGSGGAAAPAFRAIVAADLPASVPLAVTNDTNVTGSIVAQTLTLGWTGTLAAARLNANVVQGVTNDTNITATIAAQNITFAWASTLAVARGGTGGGSASGTLLDNITGFSSTGFIERTGAGTYSFIADPLPTAHGGTGLATLTAHAVLLGEGTGNLGFATIGTGGRLLIDQGAAADPSFNAMSGDATIASGGALTIAANAVTNAKAAQMAADTIKGNNTGSTANAADLTLAQVAALLGIVGQPQGRLTLTTGTAVPTSDVASATTLYYTPAVGRFVPLWNATSSVYVMTDTGGELSQTTTDTTKSPAAVTTNSNYDIFVWSDSGTIRATRGPAWSSQTVRGTGAGTTELLLQNGIYVNKNAITNGPGAGLGTYVGTVASDGSSQLNLTFGTSAAGGGPSLLTVWNAYNQVMMRAYVRDSTATWTYSTGSQRSLNNSTGNRVSFVSGLAQHSIFAVMCVHVTFASAAGAFYAPGLALDSTSTANFLAQFTNAAATANVKMVPLSVGTYAPQLGFHYIQEMEFGDGTNTNILDQASANGAGLQVQILM